MKSITQLSFLNGKQCVACLEWKPFAEYRKRKDSLDGYRNDCKVCKRKVDKAYVEANRERVEEYAAIYRASHKEVQQKLARKYYINNVDRVKKRTREYQEINRERNRSRVRIKTANYNAKKRRNGGHFSDTQWRAMCDYYGNICLCCLSQKPLTVDHVIPISKGGPNLITNLQPLCITCNKSKHCKDTDYRPDMGAFAQTLVNL